MKIHLPNNIPMNLIMERAHLRVRSQCLKMNVQQLIDCLNLEPHREGGYYRRTYAAKMDVSITTDPERRSENDPSSGVQRSIMTSIFYLLTTESPTMHLNFNRSDIIHYFHLGSPVEFIIIHHNGQVVREMLGPDLLSGEKLQVVVPGGSWRCATMRRTGSGDFTLTSEAVAPGFDYADNQLATGDEIKRKFPHLWETVQTYIVTPQ